MPRATILAIGKIKMKAFKILEEEYLERLKHYTAVTKVCLVDSPSPKPAQKKLEDSREIEKNLKKEDVVILLDELGESITSENWAKQIQEDDNRSIRSTVYIIGGPYGVTDALKARANRTYALSALTLPHELARVLLAEQLYRAHTIIKGEKYHH